MNKDFLTYGACRAMGKAIAAFLALVSPAWAGPVNVLALGDSLTQGYGLVQGQGFVPQLQKWIEDKGANAVLVNGGVSGDTTAGGAARVEWSLTPEIGAMIVTLGGNDLLRGLDPSVSRGNLEKILQVAQAKGIEVLLVGMSAPGNYGADYKADFDAIYPDLAQLYGTLYAGHFFAGLGDGGPAEMQAYFQPDGIHPNAEGVVRIVETLGPKVLELIAATK